MKKTFPFKHSIACFVSLIFFISFHTIAKAQCTLLNENFNNPLNLAATNTDGAWYPDRYQPAAFKSYSFNGENVLKISIDGQNDGVANRPPEFSSSFYNTQGRKFNQCGGCVTVFKGDLYIPADWKTSHRRTDMWATAYDASNTISAYPILGFRNVDGAHPGIYYYDVSSGNFIQASVDISYDTWYHLQFRLTGSKLEYLVNNQIVGTLPSLGSTYFGNVIMQAYNFNDPAISPASGTQSADSYDAYWDNLVTTGTGGKVVTNINTGETFCSIQGAIDDPQTHDGQTLVVGPGTYNESVLVNKQLVIKGAKTGTPGKGRSGSESIVDPNSSTSNGFKVVTDNVTIDGFTITNSADYPSSSSERYGVVTIEKTSSGQFTNISVKNNIISREFKAVDFNYTDNFEISGNWLHGENDPYNYGCMWIDDYGTSSTNGLVKNNDLDGYGSAVEIQGDLTHPVSKLNITENRSSGSQYVFFGLQNSNVYRNSVLDVTTGSHVFIGGGCNNDLFSENFFDNGTSNGIRVSNDYGAGINSSLVITNNRITGHNASGKYEISVDNSAYTGSLSATCNWYGTTNAATIATKISGPVTYSPFLSSGTDNSTSPGFQPQPNTCTGCPNGNVKNLNTGLTYCSIQAAIDDPLTLNGHTLKASAGTFVENVNVYKQLTIKGNNSGITGTGSRTSESIVDGNFISAAFAVNNSNITIDGFSIVHGQNGLNAGVSMDASKGNNKIINNIIRNNAIGIYANCATASLIKDNWLNVNNNLPAASGGSAIYSEYTTNLTVEDNDISNHTENNPVIFAATAAGVHKNLIFTKNNLHDNTYGIYLVSVNNGTFTNNNFYVSNATCVAFAGACQSNVVNNNLFKGSYRGIRVEDDGYGYGANSNITVNENSFTNSFASYILLSGSYTPSNLDATCNWYGTTSETSISPKITGPVTFKPYLTDGSDVSANRGFQPKANVCNGPLQVCNLSGGTISMSPSTPVKGQNIYTIYRGYGPTCATLTPATISGGTSPYTYNWSTGSANKSVSVCPTVTTTYTLTIKDKNGCSLVKTFTVKVIDARCGPNKDRVLFCINNKADCDTKQQADAHINHGDKLGPCGSSAKSAHIISDIVTGVDVLATEQTVNVYPNPSVGSFAVKLENYNNMETEIIIADISGRLIETKNIKQGLQTQVVNFELKNKMPGMYLVKVITQEGVKIQKVMVVNK